MLWIRQSLKQSNDLLSHAFRLATKRNHSSSNAPPLPNTPAQTTTSTKITTTKFQDMPLLHKLLKKNVAHMKMEKMTEIQQQAYNPIADGLDVNMLSPPDTGKTLAFLLPFLNDKLSVHMIKKGIHCVFLTPDSNHATANYLFTSELLQLMGPNITVQALYDSYSIQREVQRLSKKVPTILIATPTRLRQHLESSVLSKKKSRKSTKKKRTEFATKFTELTKTLVLDEADVLLKDHAEDLEFIRPYLAMGDDAKRHTILMNSHEFPMNADVWLRDHTIALDARPRPKPSNVAPTDRDFADAEEIQAQTKLMRKRWIKETKRIKAEWKEKVSIVRPSE